MNWILLIIAGFFEVAFAACLGKVKETTGTEMMYWYIGFVVCLDQYDFAGKIHTGIANRYRICCMDRNRCRGDRTVWYLCF